MKKFNLNRKEVFLRFSAIAFAFLIVISSATMIEVVIASSFQEVSEKEPHTFRMPFKERPCAVSSIHSEDGDWVSFDNNTTPAGTQAKAFVTVSDTSGLTLVADFFGFWEGNFTADGSKYYDTIDMPGTSSISAAGKPMLPQLIEYVEIPYNVNLSLDVISVEMQNMSDYCIRPAPKPAIPVWNASVYPLIIDEVYQNETVFPSLNAGTYGGLKNTSLIMRGRRLLEVTFYPVLFYPAMDILEVSSQIVIRLRYDSPAQIEQVRPELRSYLFCSVFNHSLLYCRNWEFTRTSYFDWFEISRASTGSAEYLIITVEEYLDDVQRLAAWKNRKGVLTKIKVVDTGTPASNIKHIIKDAYDNWRPAPTYVLLFGDCEDIPTNYEELHQGTFDNIDGTSVPYYDETLSTGGIGSDLPYFTVDGSDHYPDIFYGRISVDTQNEAEIVVNKILEYEKYPPLNDAFYKNILSTAYFQDDRDWNGIEDEGYEYVKNADKIAHFLSEQGYSIHTNYSAFTGNKPLWGYGIQSWVIPNLPQRWDYSTQSYVTPNPSFWINASELYYNEAASNITANLNEGRFLVYHLNHGGSKNMIYPKPFVDYYGLDQDTHEGWSQPSFNVTDLPGLSNSNLLPLVINIDCNTGWFDGEDDQSGSESSPYLDPSNPPDETFYYPDFSLINETCFAENITRMDGGAIACIASSRIIYNKYGMQLLEGIIQAFWPEYMGLGNEPIYEMGAALMLGKMNVAKRISQESSTTYENFEEATFHSYHLIGDPETQLWTGEPLPLDVDYPNQICAFGKQRFVVNVSESGIPVEYAKVCLQKGNDVHIVGYTNHLGQVVFNIKSMSYIGKMNITVTKHNYRAHIGEIDCLCGAATLDVSPDRSKLGVAVHFTIDGFLPREDVDIYVDNTRVTTIPAWSSTKLGVVPEGGIYYVNVIAVGSTSGQVATTVFKRMPDIPSNDIYIYSQWDWSTWHLSGGHRTWDNPCITIYNQAGDIIQPNQVAQMGLYNVGITVYNQGDGDSTYTEVRLSYARFGGGLSWKDSGVGYLAIPSGESRQVNITFQPILEGPYCLKAAIYDSGDENDRNNRGLENLDVVEFSSPKESDFFVGNPPEGTPNYVGLCVRQLGNFNDVWNASVIGYFSQPMINGANESTTLRIDPGSNIDEGDWRVFSVEVCINGELIGGFSINATMPESEPPLPPLLPVLAFAIGVGVGIVITLVLIFGKDFVRTRRSRS